MEVNLVEGFARIGMRREVRVLKGWRDWLITILSSLCNDACAVWLLVVRRE